MKGKFSLMWRVAVALVLVLSFSLVAVVPVYATSVGTVTVTVSPTTLGLNAKYTINFTTTTALAIDEDITIVFTSNVDADIPATYTTGDVTVNGVLVAGSEISSGAVTTVTMDTPVGIAASGSVAVIFEKPADIKNPGTAGSKTLTVATATDTTATTSTAYIISGYAGKPVSLYTSTGVFVNSYELIAEAVAAALTTYTIKVDAGTYAESPTISTAKITLESIAGAASTIIQGEIIVDPDGDNFVLGGAAGKGFTLKGSANLVSLRSGTTDVTISYNTFDTTGTPTNGILIVNGATSGLTVTENAFTITDKWDLGVYGAMSCTMSGVTITNNTFTGTSNLLETSAIVIEKPDISSISTTISGNTMTAVGFGVAIGRDQAAAGLVTDTSAATLKVSGNTFDGCYYGLDIVNANDSTEANQQNLVVVGNTFSGCKYAFTIDYGLYTIAGDNLQPDDFAVKYNNFSGNTLYGLYNAKTVAVAATHCWWGDATGPSGAGTGSGDKITTYVTYSPYAGASVSASDYSLSTTSLNAQSTVGVWVTSSETAAVGVASYTSNPQETPEFTAVEDGFFDVYAYKATWGTSALVTIKLYADGATADSKAYFWSDTEGAWVECYEQGAASGYVWVKVRPYSAVYPERVPVLTDLIELPFAIGTEVAVVTLESISASPSSVTLDVGDTQAITVTATYSDASTANVTATSSYASSATSKATVSAAGLITAVAAGSATITVSYETKTDTVSVTVSVFDPMDYDANGDGAISKTEAITSVADYFDGVITKANALAVIAEYMG